MHDKNGQFLSIGDTVSFTVDIFDGDAPLKTNFEVQGAIEAFSPNKLHVKIASVLICNLIKVRPSAVLKV